MYFSYIFKELFGRISRTILNITTIAIMVLILILITSLMNAYSSAAHSSFKGINSDLVLQKSENNPVGLNGKIRLPFGRAIFDDSEINRISSVANVEDMAKSIILWNFKKDGFQSIEGIEINGFISKKLSSFVSDGKFLEQNASNKAMLESHYAKFNHIRVGDNITIENETFMVVGLLKNKDNSQVFSSNIYIPYYDAFRIGKVYGFNQIYLKLAVSNVEIVKSKIKQINGNIIISENSISASVENLVNIYNRFFFVGIAVITLISIIVIFKISALNLFQKHKDIAIMQAVGWTRNDISKQITSEVFLQNLIGFILGVLFSGLIIAIISPVSIQSVGNLGVSQKIQIPLSLSLSSLTEYFALTLFIALLVSFLLIRSISSIKPNENLKKIS
jgi:ABC-type lipoprotein release transport system permease subunit